MKKVIASASLLALGAAGAVAQMTTTGADGKPWSISGSLRGFYDDNINTAPEGPNRIDSFGFEVGPSASYNFNSGPTTLTASYAYWLQYYFERRNTDQSHDIELALNHNFSARYSAGLTESFIIAQDPQVLAGSGPVTTPLRSNGNNLHNAVGLNFQAQITRLFGLVLGYNNSIFSYDENAGNIVDPGNASRSALLDTVEHTFTIDSTWTIDEATRGVFGYKFDALFNTSSESVENDPEFPGVQDGYPYSSGSNYIPADSRNNYSHYVYVGADHSFRSDLSGSARVGIQYVDYYNDVAVQAVNGIPVSSPLVPTSGKNTLVKSSNNSVSPYATLSLNYTYGDGGMLNFGFNYSHNQTDQAANAADPGAGVTEDEKSAVVYLTATQKLTPISPRLVGSATLQYQNSTFNQGPVNGETDNFYTLGLDLSYAFNPHISAETGYNYSLLASDLSGRGYDRNQVFLGVKATY
jgi:hypothetical protein